MAGRGDYFSGIGLGGPRLNAPSANPFQQAVQSDPWAGLRQAGQVPMQPLSAAPVQPTSRVPAYSPITDPNGPLARSGWIGALLAQGPTKAEHMAQQLGAAQQGALTSIGQRMQSGMSPQRAILDFANSQEGSDFFVNGGGFTDLANMAKGLTPPVVEGVVMSPGQEMRNPYTAELMGQPVAPTEVQKFNAFADIADMTDDEKKQAAQAQILKDQTGDMSAAEAAMARLVAGGRIKQETADLILGGVITPQPILDEAGKTIGYGVFDKSNGSFTQLPTVGQAAGQLPQPNSKDYATGVTPGTEPEKQPDNGPVFEGMQNAADIVDAAGPIGWLVERTLPLFGNYDPSGSGKETIQKRQVLGRIMADANNLGNNGRMLKQEQEDLRNLSNTLGFMNSPVTAATTLLGLHDQYDNLERRLNEIANSRGGTAAVKGNALVDIANIQRARANLPTREDLKLKMTQLESQAPGKAMGEAVSNAEKPVEKALGTGAQPEQPAGGTMDFQNMGQVTEAWKAGKLRKGMTVRVGNKTYPVTADPPEAK